MMDIHNSIIEKGLWVLVEVEAELGSKQAFRPLGDPLLVYIQSHLDTCCTYIAMYDLGLSPGLSQFNYGYPQSYHGHPQVQGLFAFSFP